MSKLRLSKSSSIEIFRIRSSQIDKPDKIFLEIETEHQQSNSQLGITMSLAVANKLHELLGQKLKENKPKLSNR